MAQKTDNKRRGRRRNADEGTVRKRSRYLDEVKVIDINDQFNVICIPMFFCRIAS